LVGALIPDLQPGFSFAAALTATAKEPEPAKALIRFLASPEASPVIVKMGLQPMPGR
jgi:molybdate transport system substrate-binding protein